MSSLPEPDRVEAPPDDRNHDRAPIHLARELDRVFLDHYVARNLPLKGRRTAGFIASAAQASEMSAARRQLELALAQARYEAAHARR